MTVPLIVDKKTRRFWALIDPMDGTLYCVNVSSDIDAGPRGHDEVVLFTRSDDAERAVAVARLAGDRLVACEVIVSRRLVP
jgi:hypothetical protein